MKYFASGILLIVLVAACSDQRSTADTTAPANAANISAGKTIADTHCTGCHGLDGKGAAPGIPHLAAQLPEYLVAAMNAYKNEKRTHAALRDLMAKMTDSEINNLAAYYASLAPVAQLHPRQALVSPYEDGKEKATALCAKCHGKEGNSTTEGVPSLAGQQPLYFVSAVQAYLDGARRISTMEPVLRGLRKISMENMAIYYASQLPTQRPAPAFGDPTVGEPLSANCGGCHGANGVSHDATIPNLAGQDPRYLVNATKAYRDDLIRHHQDMSDLLKDSTESGIENIAAFYALQKGMPAERGPTTIKHFVDQCERCHNYIMDNRALAVPKIHGQNKDYLIISLRAYRDGKRESTLMHKMSLPYTDTIIESIATWYANQSAK